MNVKIGARLVGLASPCLLRKITSGKSLLLARWHADIPLFSPEVFFHELAHFHLLLFVMIPRVFYIFLLIVTAALSNNNTSQPSSFVQQPWTLPVFPSKKTAEKPLPQPHYFKSYSINETVTVATAAQSGKLIPRYIWIAVKNASSELNYQIPELFKRNPLWRGFVCGNEEKVSVHDINDYSH